MSDYIKLLEYAEKEATASPCKRRKYCCLLVNIAEPDNFFFKGVNVRVSSCCNDGCIRDILKLSNGQRVEIGAEVHAEQQALSRFSYYAPFSETPNKSPHWVAILAALNSKTGKALTGVEALPCHNCAIALKDAGIKSVVIKDNFGKQKVLPISDVIFEREMEWGLID